MDIKILQDKLDALDAPSIATQQDAPEIVGSIWAVLRTLLSSLNVEALDQSTRQAIFDMIAKWYQDAIVKPDLTDRPLIEAFIERVAWQFLSSQLRHYLALG